ncbi:hypothetical protein BYT27DRAFT_7245878 [Phlegmacium glaucopus]|nr:hypothetical protein BYT27DRAFT_7245878 [Phlegmacium glaucopus]
MYIIPSLVLVVSFLAQITVLAVPVPLNYGVSIHARAPLLNDQASLELVARAGLRNLFSKSKPLPPPPAPAPRVTTAIPKPDLNIPAHLTSAETRNKPLPLPFQPKSPKYPPQLTTKIPDSHLDIPSRLTNAGTRYVSPEIPKPHMQVPAHLTSSDRYQKPSSHKH